MKTFTAMEEQRLPIIATRGRGPPMKPMGLLIRSLMAEFTGDVIFIFVGK